MASGAVKNRFGINLILIVIASYVMANVCLYFLPKILPMNIPFINLEDLRTVILFTIFAFSLIFFQPFSYYLYRYVNTKKISVFFPTGFDYLLVVIVIFCIVALPKIIVCDISQSNRVMFIFVGLYFFAYFIFSMVLSENLKKRSMLSKSPKDVLSDLPITDAENDILSRGSFIQNLEKQIKSLSSNDSYVYSLYGGWGDGKTSVLHLLKNRFVKDKRWLVVHFEPWYYKDEEGIAKAFFNELERAISEHFILQRLGKLFNKYVKMMNVGFSFYGLNFQSTPTHDNNVETIKNEIAYYIKLIDRKILIIIDDIDRLEPNEILLLFKLTRLNCSFEKTVFLLSMDRDVVEKKINPLTGEKAIKYIEKIVQNPIILPYCEKALIDNFILHSDHQIETHQIEGLAKSEEGLEAVVAGFLKKSRSGVYEIVNEADRSRITLSGYQGELEQFYEKANSLLDKYVLVHGKLEKGKLNISGKQKMFMKYRLSAMDQLLRELKYSELITQEEIKQFDSRYTYLFRTSMAIRINNLRDVKRYMSSVRASLPVIVEEVDLTDFCLLEWIKVFYPRLYEDIYRNWWFYVESQYRGDAWIGPFAITSSDSNKDEKSKEHIEALLKEMDINNVERAIIATILAALFNRCKTIFNKVSIDNSTIKKLDSQSFAKYFILKVPQVEIADGETKRILKRWDDSQNPAVEIEKTVFEFRTKGLLIDLFESIEEKYIDRLSASTSKLLIGKLCELAHIFSSDSRDFFLNSELGVLSHLLMKILNERIVDGEIEQVFKVLVLKSSSLYLSCSLMERVLPGATNDFSKVRKNVNAEAVVNEMSSYLNKRFIDEREDIFKIFAGGARGLSAVCYQWASNWGLPGESNREKVTDYLVCLMKENVGYLYTFLKAFRSRLIGTEEEEGELDVVVLNKAFVLPKLVTVARHHIDTNAPNKKIMEELIHFVSRAETKKQKGQPTLLKGTGFSGDRLKGS